MAAKKKFAPKRRARTEAEILQEREDVLEQSREAERLRRASEGYDDPTGQDEDVENLDPNVVIESPGREWGYIKLPGIKTPVRFDKMTLVVEPIGPMYGPVRLPKPFSDVAQPFIHTCQMPIPGQVLGCLSANGCPYGRKHPWIGQFNVIIHMDGRITFTSCDKYWHGVNAAKRPMSNHHYKLDGWDLVLDRTTVPVEVAVCDKDGRLMTTEEIDVEVQNLGPMYWPLLRKKGLPLPSWAEQFGRRRPMPEAGRGAALPVDFEEQNLKNLVDSHPTTSAGAIEMGKRLARSRQSKKLVMNVPELNQ